MNYVNNKDLLKLIIEYKKSKSIKIYNKIGKCFILIAKNLLNKPRYINYTQDIKDELVSEATFTMCRYVNKFDETKYNNPFAYFTRFAFNSFKLYFQKYYIHKDRFISLSFIENFDKEIFTDE